MVRIPTCVAICLMLAGCAGPSVIGADTRFAYPTNSCTPAATCLPKPSDLPIDFATQTGSIAASAGPLAPAAENKLIPYDLDRDPTIQAVLNSGSIGDISQYDWSSDAMLLHWPELEVIDIIPINRAMAEEARSMAAVRPIEG